MGNARPEREHKGGEGETKRGGVGDQTGRNDGWILTLSAPHIKAEHVSLNVTLSYSIKEHHSKTAYNNTTHK